MASHPIIDLSRLREIGWKDWDPIGLAGSGCTADEYDSYLLQVVSRLRRGDAVAEVAEYLIGIASEHMGLGEGSSSARNAAETTVVHIQQYLGTLPPGTTLCRRRSLTSSRRGWQSIEADASQPSSGLLIFWYAGVFLGRSAIPKFGGVQFAHRFVTLSNAICEITGIKRWIAVAHGEIDRHRVSEATSFDEGARTSF